MKRVLLGIFLILFLIAGASASEVTIVVNESGDGQLGMDIHNLSWAQDRDNTTATTGGTTGTTINAWVSGDLETGKWYRYYRPFWIIQRDPAVLPDDAVITALDLIVNVKSAANTTLRDGWVNIVMFHVDGRFSLDDYNNFDFANASDSVRLSAIPTGNNTFHITNLSAIPTSGDIGFAALFDSDIMNYEPGWGSGCQTRLTFRTAEDGAQYAAHAIFTYGQPPVSEFSSVADWKLPLTVQFTDASIDATAWAWNFGDGSPVITVQNPAHTYTGAGTYPVTLTSSNSFGVATETRAGYITVGTFSPGFLASYYRGQSWSDLATTRVDNGIHFSDGSGSTWPVSLVGRQNDFSVAWDGYLLVPAEADYTFTLTSDDGSWLWVDEVQLIDNGGMHGSTAVTGTTHLTAGYHHIVVKMYENTYSAVADLTFSPAGSIWHIPAPTAGFTGVPRAGMAPLAVQFTDTSLDATAWSWDFGDGNSTNATAQNPVHTYLAAGTYTVNLTATNAAGSDSEVKVGYIEAASVGNITGYVPLTVQFNDTSTNGPVSYSWNFGDGNTSVVKNASHTYAYPGFFDVNLSATNFYGTNSSEKKVYVIALEQTAVAPLAMFLPRSPLVYYSRIATVNFTGASTGSPTACTWIFGDGTTTTGCAGATHTYYGRGTYPVLFTASNAAGNSTNRTTVTLMSWR